MLAYFSAFQQSRYTFHTEPRPVFFIHMDSVFAFN